MAYADRVYEVYMMIGRMKCIGSVYAVSGRMKWTQTARADLVELSCLTGYSPGPRVCHSHGMYMKQHHNEMYMRG